MKWIRQGYYFEVSGPSRPVNHSEVSLRNTLKNRSSSSSSGSNSAGGSVKNVL